MEPKTVQSEPLLLTTGKAADRLGIGIRRVRALVDSGQLRSVQVNGGWRYVPRAALDEYVDSSQTRTLGGVAVGSARESTHAKKKN